jgi:hypothetical protein
MLSASKLLEYLWEPAVLHVAYLQNRSYTRHLQKLTPYHAWNGKIPDVSHLWEFGAPIWILLQGKHKDQKMLPKSQKCAYIGYDDGANAVKYYNTETRTILTSRNFRIAQPACPESPEQVTLVHLTREGEASRGTALLIQLIMLTPIVEAPIREALITPMMDREPITLTLITIEPNMSPDHND